MKKEEAEEKRRLAEEQKSLPDFSTITAPNVPAESAVAI